jgi:diguanylate cyclase (GGDEF)-like protein
MKRCSSCEKEYTDDELRFCKECGKSLVDVSKIGNEFTTRRILKSDSAERVNPITFPTPQVFDKTLTKPRKREIDELIVSQHLNPKLFKWEEDVSSKFQRPDVRVSKLVVDSTGFYFLFNSTREGSMFFTRSPGLNSTVEDGSSGDWPHHVAAVRDWLTALKAEMEEHHNLRLQFEDSISGTEIDALLGVYQRGVFERDLQEFAKHSTDAGTPLVLVMCDVDKFKNVNDKYGHPAGDEVLKFIAHTVKNISTGKGKTYRYGGEELALLLPNYSAEEAAALAERIRKALETQLIGAEAIKMTASFGVAELPTHATTPKELVEAADKALYCAKNLGRNLVRISGEPEPEQPARIVHRRLPDGNGLTDAELETILSEWFRYYNAFCPKDGTHLDIEEIQYDDRVTVDLIISCRRCGLMERIDGADADGSKLTS